MKLVVTDRDGAVHEIDAPAGGSLMELLRDRDLGVDGTCGGMASCASCHVHVAEQDLARLDAPADDEALVLDGLIDIAPGSRLACQIRLVDALDGLALTIAPEF